MMIDKKPMIEIAISRNDICESNNNIHSNDGEIIFLVAGRTAYRKGHQFLLDALELIPNELLYQCRIVGGGSELNKLMNRCRNSQKLSSHVKFTGMLPFTEMEKEYQNADVFIMPSLRETTGSVLLEAMSKGLPVVTINRFGGSILLDQETGWLYDGNSKDEFIHNLTDSLIDCIRHPNKVKLRGRNAKERAYQYTWEEKCKHYEEIYRKLLGE